MKLIMIMLVFCFISCGIDSTHKDIGWAVSKKCIEGHVYYEGFGIKLTDDGKPIKCGKEE